MKNWIPVLLFLLSLGIRLLLFYRYYDNDVIHWDSAVYANIAANFVNGNLYNILDTYFPPLFPALIAMAYYFSNSYVEAIQIVSIIAGSLAAPAIYIFVKEFYSSRHALMAGVFAVFFSHLLNSTFGFLSENVYLLLIIPLLLFFWRGLNTGSVFKLGIAGVFLALSYLTRPEAVGYLLFFSLLILIKFFYKKYQVKFLIKGLCVFVLSFTLIASPYIFYLRKETKTWTLSAKFKQNIFVGKLSDKAGINSRISDTFATALIRSINYNANKFHQNIPHILPPFLFLLIGFGFLSKVLIKENLSRELYLFSFCVVTILGYILTVIERRYFFVLFPMCFAWLAAGILELNIGLNILLNHFRFMWAGKSAGFFIPLCIAILLLYTFPINNFIAVSKHGAIRRDIIFKNAGEWLNRNTTMPTVMSPDPRTALYSEGWWFKIYEDTNQLFRQIKGKTKYLVIDELNFGNKPEFRNLLYSPNTHPLLQPVYIDTTTGNRVIIYKTK